MRQRNKILEVCSTIALNVKEFFVILFNCTLLILIFLSRGQKFFGLTQVFKGSCIV